MKHQEHIPLPTLDRVKELLTYDADTGTFFWAVSRGRVKAGDLAGTAVNTNGYRAIRLDGVLYLAHRLAYLMHHGIDPAELTIDHIDGDVLNNSIANLRLVSQTVQMRNRRQASNNTSGTTGVCLEKRSDGDRWVATWVIEGALQRRRFSIRKHGYEAAQTLAIAARAEALATLDHYTTRHGVAA